MAFPKTDRTGGYALSAWSMIFAHVSVVILALFGFAFNILTELGQNFKRLSLVKERMTHLKDQSRERLTGLFSREVGEDVWYRRMYRN